MLTLDVSRRATGSRLRRNDGGAASHGQKRKAEAVMGAAITKADTIFVPIATIEVGERRRKKVGDLRALKASIDEHGLFHPILLREETELVAGRSARTAKLRVAPRGMAGGGANRGQNVAGSRGASSWTRTLPEP